MASHPAELPDDAVARGLRVQAQETIEAYRSYLASPAFQHSIDLAVLVKIAGDDSVPFRERRRAAEVLAKLRLQAMTALAELTGAREQSLETLGLKAGPQFLALTQVNQQIEIVRAKDWRSARGIPDGEEIEVEALPPCTNGELNGHTTNGAKNQQQHDAEDPAA